MDENNETNENFSETNVEFFSENLHESEQSSVISQQTTINSTPSVPMVVEEIDSLLIELDNRYKALTSSIVDAREVCNKIKKKKEICKKRIDDQEDVIKNLKFKYVSHETNGTVSEKISDHKNSIKQNHCNSIASYANKISQEIESTPQNISTLIKAAQEELEKIEEKSQMIIELQELNKLFQSYKQLQQHSDAAENRFQAVIKIFGDNKNF